MECDEKRNVEECCIYRRGGALGFVTFGTRQERDVCMYGPTVTQEIRREKIEAQAAQVQVSDGREREGEREMEGHEISQVNSYTRACEEM